jgi:hypothetical protein
MHLAVAISFHGFGHGAQTSAVLTALRVQYPELRLTLLTGLPQKFLADRIPGEFELIDWRGDFGLRMASALEADLVRSAADYAAFHANWDQRLVETSVLLERLAPDLLLANVPYLPLAASARLGLPSIALCSLNWADIYRHYFSDRPESSGILECMLSAYNSAEQFLCPTPSMPMLDLNNVQPIGPLARLGRDCRESLCAQLDVRESQRIVVIAPGGFPLQLPLGDWPKVDDITWIIPDDCAASRTDMHTFSSLGIGFTDLLGSVDAVLGKLGYGTVAECACNGTPLLYMPRPDWPEEDCLATWLQAHGRCLPATFEQVMTGELRETLEQVWAQPMPPVPQPTGAEEAARIITQLLKSE